MTTLALNPYALVFVIPALYAWLWLPQLANGPAWSRGALLALGLTGPLFALFVLARALDLGLDVIPYTLQLFTSGYASSATTVVLLGWAAVAGQLAALAAGRYAPYPSSREQRPRGPLRRAVRRLVLARRARSQPDVEREQAVGG